MVLVFCWNLIHQSISKFVLYTLSLSIDQWVAKTVLWLLITQAQVVKGTHRTCTQETRAMYPILCHQL
jgi:hypothetical protein